MKKISISFAVLLFASACLAQQSNQTAPAKAPPNPFAPKEVTHGAAPAQHASSTQKPSAAVTGKSYTPPAHAKTTPSATSSSTRAPKVVGVPTKSATTTKATSPKSAATGTEKKSESAAPVANATPAASATPAANGVIAPAPPVSPFQRRDPFISPVQLMEMQRAGQSCSGSGKRCLNVEEVQLKGTVLMHDGRRLALVESPGHRVYTLNERDQLYDGSVEKINDEMIVFRETVTDRLGHVSSKEVTKKVSIPPV